MDNIVGGPVEQRPVPAVIDLVLPVERLSIVLIKFNRIGTLIAAGAVNGYLALIDFTIKRTASMWNAHVLGVSSICWSRDGSKLFSTALDNTFVISDVETGTVIQSLMLGPGLIGITLNPRNDDHVLFNTSSGIRFVTTSTKEKQPLERYKEDDVISYLIFDRRGQHVIAGTAKGFILIYNLSGKCIKSGSIDSPQPIRSLYATKKLNLIIVTATDRFIRVYDYDEFHKDKEVYEAENKLFDFSNKTIWQSACSSGESDYIAAMSATSHTITIFERVTGAIVANLCESKKEIPLSFDWHPLQPAVASVCNGQIFVWKQKPRACWAAYAPHFKELGENMTYQEKETEFDHYDEDMDDDEITRRNVQEEFISVDDYKAPSPLCSSDDEDPKRCGKYTIVANAETITFKDVPSRPRLPIGMVMDPMNACDTQYIPREQLAREIKTPSASEESNESADDEGSDRDVNGGLNGYASSSPVENGHGSARTNGYYDRKKKKIHRKHRRKSTSSRSSSDTEESDEHSSSSLSVVSDKKKSKDDSSDNIPDNRFDVSSENQSELSDITVEPTKEDWDEAGTTMPVLEKEKTKSPSSISDTPLNNSSRNESLEIQPSSSTVVASGPPQLSQSSVVEQISDVSSDDSSPPKKRKRKSSSSSTDINHAWDSD